jgi:hypothetical protein
MLPHATLACAAKDLILSAHLRGRLEGWTSGVSLRPWFETPRCRAAPQHEGLLLPLMLLATLSGASPAIAQVKVHPETIRPGAAATPPATYQFVLPSPQSGARDGPAASAGSSAGAAGSASSGEILADPSPLPAAVAETRERILGAAATGDLTALTSLMRAKSAATAFSHTQRQDPIAYWKDTYPDSGGIEILSILISILETPPAHLNAGTAQEIYVWPYFARLPIAALTPAQKVELFRIVTGSDYRSMLERGRYVFYQVGITPDGSWRYFLASDE